MKKTNLLIFVFMLVVLATACSYDYELRETTLDVVVVACEENIHLDYSMEQMAKHTDSAAMHKYYMDLAFEKATCDYTVAFVADGEEHKITIKTPAEVGETISITKKETIINGQITNVKYE